MDKSKLYVDMCRKAKKFLSPDTKTHKVTTRYTNGLNYDEDLKRLVYTWEIDNKLKLTGILATNDHINTFPVYRQDQLQELVYKPINTNAVSAMFEEVSEFGNTFLLKSPQRTPQTAEQLWLCFIMDQKYLKQWNGKDWIKP